ncbi:MAG: asparagine synthase C-terminal domain-containing protein [Candidatus Woesearchaeota archaeon]|jgi:asparagine synthase (glutamine-hydrolysing)|nr:asparagine synthase C-terminal domain-containing protein [Candidatus Woesearchaeota archaeon]MDP7623242.1 asparagine synthase C-terminal domain-containing protein [Candidatus Woesearchaeota archaeon]HJN56982.1 asparagine synthase C-terminal domain-containing protein [Candidatus Woesearchaeota archaeon]|tara:strand:+ start:19519 stop:20439 length:921 start_codon:yes stop_codon:yes gene_type:complete
MEIFIKDKGLIKQEEWEYLIGSIETSFDNLETNKERAKRKLKESIEIAIKKRTENTGKFGVLFSGGVDSTFIAYMCKKLNLNFTCFTIGIENSQDIEYAKKIAEIYDFDLKYKTLSLDEFENILKDTVKILKSSEIVWASVGSVENAVLKLAIENNVTTLLTGLGTEELFAGYQRHDEALMKNGTDNFDFEALHKECWNGLKNMWHRDLLRVYKITKHLGIDIRTPFLDLDMIKTAMNVHPMFKLDKNDKKIILREIAEDMGLDKEFAYRKKKAAQYGSNFVKGIDKLAKKHGFNTKKEYLQRLLS